MKKRILIVDDEKNMRRILEALLTKEGYEVAEAVDGESALAWLKGNICHAVITDLLMPGMDGLVLMEHILKDHPGLPVIIITAHGTIETAVDAMKKGAFDYITKPFEQDEMRTIVYKAVKTQELNQKDILPEFEYQERFGIIGDSPVMKEIYKILEKIWDSPSTVLITGESGTGKELIARVLHERSFRKGRPFIKVNCAAIPENLVESELFGYEKGAFTGAVGSKPGRFELAHTGTLFLDEIAEIKREVQVKLLRVLQEQEFERVGGIKTLKVDVRLIAATNRDLQKEVREGNFREDLFYRLNVIPIKVPPLRERKEDIPLLIHHFIAKYNKRLNKSVQGISEEAKAALMEYNWPGNIRELENVIERTVLLLDSDFITLKDLPEELRSLVSTRVAYNISTELPGRVEPDLKSISAPQSGELVGTGSPPNSTSEGQITGSREGGSDLKSDLSLKEAVKQATAQVERNLIIKALQETRGNVTRAAKKLGISRKSLQTKMKEYELREKEWNN
ncbi:MAG TPA: sigma-54 dependent transcriptional regulator [Candidatus Limnocylindrales bacterium]|nr:sigma-54 dependent transcriptional regulator [Candidatus Limnocylindrales bacterium]